MYCIPLLMGQEEAIRHWASTSAYRMDLSKARSHDPEEVASERARFIRALQPMLAHPGPKIVVTDSQVESIPFRASQ